VTARGLTARMSRAPSQPAQGPGIAWARRFGIRPGPKVDLARRRDARDNRGVTDADAAGSPNPVSPNGAIPNGAMPTDAIPADGAAIEGAAIEGAGRAGAFSGYTAWARGLETPLREFLRTETGSAAVLLGATIAALVWVNIDAGSYDRVWSTSATVSVGHWNITQDLRDWVSKGLMTLFFFVVGLEARREFDVGELRERRRVALPAAAGAGGMLIPIAIFLIFNGARSSAHGWGAAMSTDTAFAIGLLSLVRPPFGERLRVFLLTVSVVDDLLALVVIAIFYSDQVSMTALGVAVAIFLVVVGLRAISFRYGVVYAIGGAAVWAAMYSSGIEPVVVGLAMGLVTYAYPAGRGDLERASEVFRLFREQPTPELAREAQVGVAAAVSPNERLARSFHPWTSYLIVPLFALSNAGVVINGSVLARAFRSPITLGIMIGYIVGKPVGIALGANLVRILSRGRLRPPVGWASMAGAGAIAGIGFTVSLLISTIAFTGPDLAEAKIGVLAAALGASLLSWLVFRATDLLPRRARVAALIGTAESIIDLAVPVDPEHDRVRGPSESLVTIVEYGDFECPYCGRAEPVVRELLADHGEVRYVFRHLPLTDVHPHAQLAAEAVEAAAAQGRFWEMHDKLFDNQDALRLPNLLAYADELGLDPERFRAHLRKRAGAGRIAEDVDSADLSGVSGTPTFFINGLRHRGAFDIASLTEAVRAAKARAFVDAGNRLG